MIVWYGLTMFVSAGLLFLVQPMIARMVLPLLGGAPAVWTACMLFFQMLLLAGYAYADLAPRFLGVRRHALVHLVLILVPLLFLPIQLSGRTPPAGAENPVLWLLLTLTLASGLPFFVLATQAPLLQRWFAATTHRAAGDPYFLYAASNVGSLLALLSYPVLIEPWLPLAEQARLWALGYGGMVFLVAGCALLVWRRSAPLTLGSSPEAGGEGSALQAAPGQAHPGPRGTADQGARGSAIQSAPELSNKDVSWARRLRWLALAFVPSSLMLGITTYLTTDISPIPLLWVIPLALYLFSFVLAFSRLPRGFYQGSVVAFFLLVAALVALRFDRIHWLIDLLNDRYTWDLLPLPPRLALSHVQVIALHLLCFFIAALICHGELAALRPAASQLTGYYLWIALGGVLGGIFNSIVAPLVFDRIIEYPLLFAAVCLLRPRFTFPLPRIAWSRLLSAASLVFGIVAAACFLVEASGYAPGFESRRIRNFFGTLLASHSHSGLSELIHGTTVHGTQDLSSPELREEPTSYYTRSSGIGRVIHSLFLHPPHSIGAIGLGAGTVAAYAVPSQTWVFYEINPAVPGVADDPAYFTYLEDARKRGAEIQIVLGDARLSIAAGARIHDLLIVDAFSSDAIPVHLLTREALQVYLAKLSPHGLIAFHVTNYHVDLTGVLADLARDFGMSCVFFDDEPASYRSWWMVLARRDADIAELLQESSDTNGRKGSRWERCQGRRGVPVWTDDFSNLYGVLHLSGVGDTPQALLDNEE
jgi:hypothetical protein